jgi:group II intron reverse transcriptase/maturase
MKTFKKLKQIIEKVKTDKKFEFHSLAHLINVESLSVCYWELKRNKASGVDGVTVEGYGKKLQENLSDLVERMKAKKYRPQPVRRVYIPKAGKKELRGLGIPTVEDKIVQMMMKKILEAIFEPDFLDCSNGFRPDRSCHVAVNQLDKVVMTKPVSYIVEVDIRKFFDNVRHYWLLRCVEERVGDPNFLWLLRKFLKAGVMEDGMWKKSRVGTPQGGVISPLLANIYLHYVLDLWFEKVFKRNAKGYVKLIRYCDDFIVAVEYREEAERFLRELKERLKKFNLEISEEKTKIIKFGRKVWYKARSTGGKVETFDFLGFTHYCKASRKGKFIMGHKTSKQNLSGKLKEVKVWLKNVRNLLPLRIWMPVLKAKLTGHYNYFGISGNIRSLQQFYYEVVKVSYKWINRRSQKRSMTWKQFFKYLERHPLPKPKIYHSLYTLSPVW